MSIALLLFLAFTRGLPVKNLHSRAGYTTFFSFSFTFSVRLPCLGDPPPQTVNMPSIHVTACYAVRRTAGAGRHAARPGGGRARGGRAGAGVRRGLRRGCAEDVGGLPCPRHEGAQPDRYWRRSTSTRAWVWFAQGWVARPPSVRVFLAWPGSRYLISRAACRERRFSWHAPRPRPPTLLPSNSTAV